MAWLSPNCGFFWGTQYEQFCGFEIFLAHSRAQPFLPLAKVKSQGLPWSSSNVWEEQKKGRMRNELKQENVKLMFAYLDQYVIKRFQGGGEKVFIEIALSQFQQQQKITSNILLACLRTY